MPRGPRYDAPGAIHHVMIRGIEKRVIFVDDCDRAKFTSLLDYLVPLLRFLCLAWALMPNHAHLVLQTGRVPLSRLMQRLLTAYAVHFNRRHDRAGHVFQNRYRSELIDSDPYLEAVVPYVNRNPLEANLVDEPQLEDFPWCGQGAATGARAPRPFEAISATLALLGSSTASARRVILNSEVARLDLPDLPRPNWETPRIPLRQPRIAERHVGRLMREVSQECGVSAAALLLPTRARDVTRARELVASRCVRELGLSPAEVGRQLRVSRSAVSQMLERARRRG